MSPGAGCTSTDILRYRCRNRWLYSALVVLKRRLIKRRRRRRQRCACLSSARHIYLASATAGVRRAGRAARLSTPTVPLVRRSTPDSCLIYCDEQTNQPRPRFRRRCAQLMLPLLQLLLQMRCRPRCFTQWHCNSVADHYSSNPTTVSGRQVVSRRRTNSTSSSRHNTIRQTVASLS